MTSDVRALFGPEAQTGATFALRGLEADNLLAFLALLGALRVLDRERPSWQARISWDESPWLARLHLCEPVDRSEVSRVLAAGCTAIAEQFDVDGRKNVDFDREQFRAYADRVRSDPVNAALAAAVAAELPERDGKKLRAAPLVMMFGQGWQNFLERLVAVPRGDLPARIAKRKNPPDLSSPKKIEEALFEPWARADDADAFRWDPDEDQRYAFRFGDPSKAGAAPTVHGANRLAAIGFLSYVCCPASKRHRVAGTVFGRVQTAFVWPLWKRPLPLAGIEALLAHREVLSGDLAAVKPYGVFEILRAQRVNNGKFLNVARARPTSDRLKERAAG